MTQKPAHQHLQADQKLKDAKPNPNRKRRPAHGAGMTTGMTVVSRHHEDATKEVDDAAILHKAMMEIAWYREAYTIGEKIGIVEGRAIGRAEARAQARREAKEKRIEERRKAGRQTLLSIAAQVLSPEACAALAFIPDIHTLAAAFAVAYMARAR